jgi:hypothetical protein
MKALSILQPWAWLILRPDTLDPAARAALFAQGLIKDIENRTWHTPYRGEFLVHTGKTYSRAAHADYSEDILDAFGITLPAFEAMPLGGIVGKARITDCVRAHPSRWKDMGQFGFVLADQTPLPFRPLKGMLGFFEVEDEYKGLECKCEGCGKITEVYGSRWCSACYYPGIDRDRAAPQQAT